MNPLLCTDAVCKAVPDSSEQCSTGNYPKCPSNSIVYTFGAQTLAKDLL